MELIKELVSQLNSLVWGPYMLVLIFGTGVILMLGLQFMPILRLGYGFKQLWKGRDSTEEGDISPFNALMTSLSATIGTGNIVGVAAAILAGGPGAVFWMWITALVGMAMKFASCSLALKYRVIHQDGSEQHAEQRRYEPWVARGEACREQQRPPRGVVRQPAAVREVGVWNRHPVLVR